MTLRAQGSGWGPPPGGPHGGGFTPPPAPGGSGPSGWGPPPPGHPPPAVYGAPPGHGPLPGHHPPPSPDPIHTVAMVVGILSTVGMAIGLVPCLGWLNWINIPFGLVAVVLGIIGMTRLDANKTGSIVGLVLGVIAVGLGFVRLVLGAGML